MIDLANDGLAWGKIADSPGHICPVVDLQQWPGSSYACDTLTVGKRPGAIHRHDASKQPLTQKFVAQ